MAVALSSAVKTPLVCLEGIGVGAECRTSPAPCRQLVRKATL